MNAPNSAFKENLAHIWKDKEAHVNKIKEKKAISEVFVHKICPLNVI